MQVDVRVSAVAIACALLGGCAGVPAPDISTVRLPFTPAARHAAADPTTPDDPNLFPDGGDDSAPGAGSGPHMQCVPYAREHSGVNIHGNANTWWAQADGVYARGSAPVEGSVLVLTGYGRHRAHVAVVKSIVTDREIRIDHANWFNDGAIYVNDPVIDVSADNDWSAVKVWNIRTGTWGTRTYTVQGFIGPNLEGKNPLVAFLGRRDANGDDPIARQIARADVESDDDN
jgi:surface antigen